MFRVNQTWQWNMPELHGKGFLAGKFKELSGGCSMMFQLRGLEPTSYWRGRSTRSTSHMPSWGADLRTGSNVLPAEICWPGVCPILAVDGYYSEWIWMDSLLLQLIGQHFFQQLLSTFNMHVNICQPLVCLIFRDETQSLPQGFMTPLLTLYSINP